MRCRSLYLCGKQCIVEAVATVVENGSVIECRSRDAQSNFRPGLKQKKKGATEFPNERRSEEDGRKTVSSQLWLEAGQTSDNGSVDEGWTEVGEKRRV